MLMVVLVGVLGGCRGIPLVPFIEEGNPPLGGETLTLAEAKAEGVDGVATDREAWPVVVARPFPTVTVHRPVYFDRAETDTYDFKRWPGVGIAPASPLALEGRSWESDRYTAVKEPAVFLYNVVALPVKMVGEPPWSLATTPEGVVR